MAESDKELESLLMRVKEDSEKAGLNTLRSGDARSYDQSLATFTRHFVVIL